MPAMDVDDRLLGIYLNDHLAGATLGVELARRVSKSNRDDPIGQPLAEICAEIEADRKTLERLMTTLRIRRSPLKAHVAWAAEKLGRLKSNGQLSGYSPLSRVVEIEMLYIGITGKLQMWRVLDQAFGAGLEGFDFPRLALRAGRQRGRVEELHLAASARAFGS